MLLVDLGNEEDEGAETEEADVEREVVEYERTDSGEESDISNVTSLLKLESVTTA